MAHGLLEGVARPGLYTDYEGGSLLAAFYLMPFIALGGPSFFVLRVAGLAMSTLAYFFFVIVSFKSLPRPQAFFASLLFFFPPVHFYWHSMAVYGDHRWMPAASFILFLVLFRLLDKGSGRILPFFVFGFFAGLSIFMCFAMAWPVVLCLWLIWIKRRSLFNEPAVKNVLRLGVFALCILVWVLVLPDFFLEVDLTTRTLDERLFVNPFSVEYLISSASSLAEAIFEILPISLYPVAATAAEWWRDWVRIFVSLTVVSGLVAVMWHDRKILAGWSGATFGRVPVAEENSETQIRGNLPLIAIIYCAGLVLIYSLARFRSTPLEYLEQTYPMILLALASIPAKIPVRFKTSGYLPGLIVLITSISTYFAYTGPVRLEEAVSHSHYERYTSGMGELYFADTKEEKAAIGRCKVFENPVDFSQCVDGVRKAASSVPEDDGKERKSSPGSIEYEEAEKEGFAYIYWKVKRGINDFQLGSPLGIKKEISRQGLQAEGRVFMLIPGIDKYKDLKKFKPEIWIAGIRTTEETAKRPLGVDRFEKTSVLVFRNKGWEDFAPVADIWEAALDRLSTQGGSPEGSMIFWFPEENRHGPEKKGGPVEVWVPFTRTL